MNNDKTNEVLNTLIEINNDRIEGYETASKETEEADLKVLFAQFSHTSQKCKQELVNEVHAMGGTPIEGTTTSGKFFRVWMDMKSALTGNDRHAILNSCEYGEEAALETYNEVLGKNTEDISAAQLTMINAQFALLKADQEKVNALRSVLQD